MRKTILANDLIVESPFGPCAESPAEDIVSDAWEADTPVKQCRLARKALENDIRCIDAYLLLAIHAETLAENLALLKEAVSVGDSLWAPYMKRKDMVWWGFIGTRPYMRALHNLGLALEDAGQQPEAEKLYRKLIRLNPNDNQGIRCLLLRMYSTSGRIEDCRKLLRKYRKDYHLEFFLAALWLDLSDNRDVSKRIAEINERNAFVLPRLTRYLESGNWPHASPSAIRVGGEDEADCYAVEFQDAWKADKIRDALLVACKA